MINEIIPIAYGVPSQHKSKLYAIIFYELVIQLQWYHIPTLGHRIKECEHGKSFELRINCIYEHTAISGDLAMKSSKQF